MHAGELAGEIAKHADILRPLPGKQQSKLSCGGSGSEEDGRRFARRRHGPG